MSFLTSFSKLKFSTIFLRKIFNTSLDLITKIKEFFIKELHFYKFSRMIKNDNCTDCYIGESSQPLRKRLQQHTSGYSVSAVCDHLKASGHKTDLEEVKIIDREIRWFERGVKEAIWVRAENPSLNRSGGVRIKLSHAWDRTIRTLPRKFTSSSTSDDVTSGKSPESRSSTSVPS